MSTTFVTISEDTIFNVVATDIPVIVEDGINTIVGTGIIVPTISLTAESLMISSWKTITTLLSPDWIPTISLSNLIVAETPIVGSVSLSTLTVPTVSVSAVVTYP